MAWEIHRLEAFYRHQACLCKPLATPVSPAQVCEWSYLSECSLKGKVISALWCQTLWRGGAIYKLH